MTLCDMANALKTLSSKLQVVCNPFTPDLLLKTNAAIIHLDSAVRRRLPKFIAISHSTSSRTVYSDFLFS